jgi:hypothetical protein
MDSVANTPLQRRKEVAQSKSINVKVSTAKVVKALETALAERKKLIADYTKASKEYEKEMTEFRNSVAELFRSGKGKVVNTHKTRGWGNSPANQWEILVEFPASMKEPESPQAVAEWQIKSDIEELENAIALLKMTDEEFVSTSTYKGVARLIK